MPENAAQSERKPNIIKNSWLQSIKPCWFEIPLCFPSSLPIRYLNWISSRTTKSDPPKLEFRNIHNLFWPSPLRTCLKSLGRQIWALFPVSLSGQPYNIFLFSARLLPQNLVFLLCSGALGPLVCLGYKVITVNLKMKGQSERQQVFTWDKKTKNKNKLFWKHWFRQKPK